VRSIEWCHFQWPWVITNLVALKVTVFFTVICLKMVQDRALLTMAIQYAKPIYQRGSFYRNVRSLRNSCAYFLLLAGLSAACRCFVCWQVQKLVFSLHMGNTLHQLIWGLEWRMYHTSNPPCPRPLVHAGVQDLYHKISKFGILSIIFS